MNPAPVVTADLCQDQRERASDDHALPQQRDADRDSECLLEVDSQGWGHRLFNRSLPGGSLIYSDSRLLGDRTRRRRRPGRSRVSERFARLELDRLQAVESGRREAHLCGRHKLFSINTKSRPQGSSSTRRISLYARVGHVFVLMLETTRLRTPSRFPGIQGLTGHVATARDSNSCGGQSYPVGSPAPTGMPTDPGHEFLRYLEQLAGQRAVYVRGKAYPPIVKHRLCRELRDDRDRVGAESCYGAAVPIQPVTSEQPFAD